MLQSKYDRVPNQHMVGQVKRYVELGVTPSHFLYSLFANDLVGTYGRADKANRACMADWVIFIFNDLNSKAWGSPEKVDEWCRTGGEQGSKMETAKAREALARELYNE